MLDEQETPIESNDENRLQEINTYDSIPLFDEPTKNGSISLKNILKKIYSIASIGIVLLAVIFSSAEILDFIVDDMGTGNIIMNRIFSKGLTGEGLNLSELIIKNSFIIPEKEASPSQPETHSPETTHPPQTAETVPNETPSVSSKEPDISQSKPPAETSMGKENTSPILQMDMSLLSYGKHSINTSGESCRMLLFFCLI